MRTIALVTSLAAMIGCGGVDPETGQDLDSARGGVTLIEPVNIGGDTDCPACGADRVVAYQPGTNVLAPYNDPRRALYDYDFQYMSLGNGAAVLTVHMAVDIRDIEGTDLIVSAYTEPGEQYQVSFSKDGHTWISAGTFTGPANIDVRNYGASARYPYVRVRNASSVAAASPTAGPDIDAVLNRSVR